MIINTVYGQENISVMVCKICKEEKSLFDFPKHKNRLTGLDNRCKKCKIERDKIVYNLKKNNKSVPKFCECCGKLPEESFRSKSTKTKNGIRKLVLDHDPITNEFRGWICESCNHAIGNLGDNIEGIKKALNYLSKKNESF